MEVSENTGVRIGEATVDMFGIEFMCSEAGNCKMTQREFRIGSRVWIV